jgi:hypothetical protein
VKRSKANSLTKDEVPFVKAMIANGYPNQKIVAYFTRPDRSINQGRISEIRKEKRYKSIKAASDDALASFLESWPHLDPSTGLHIEQNELLIKAREAMLFAVQAFNDPKTYFRAEVFIVTAIIAWTYLLHAFYRSQGIDYRYFKMVKGKKEYLKTKHGAEKFWELTECLAASKCPLDEGTRNNLLLLVEIRHEIEHQMTKRIDDALGPHFQACCLNFNRSIKSLFSERYSLDGELSIALQFSTFSFDQVKAMLKADDLPPNVTAAQASLEAAMTEPQKDDPHYKFRFALIQKTANSKGKADHVIEVIKPESSEGKEMNRILLKETEKEKLKPKQIVQAISAAGYPRFTMREHSILWKQADAKDPAKAFGVLLGDGQWYWYNNWLEYVTKHCEANAAKYK